MNGWTKFYADGTSYIGDDSRVYAGKASWRKSSLHNIVKVTLQHGDTLLSIEGPGTYWQSDEFESKFPGGSRMVRRRIQRQIEEGDTFFWVASAGWGQGTQHHIRFHAANGSGMVFPIRRGDVGKWVVVDYDIAKGKWGYHITKGPL